GPQPLDVRRRHGGVRAAMESEHVVHQARCRPPDLGQTANPDRSELPGLVPPRRAARQEAGGGPVVGARHERPEPRARGAIAVRRTIQRVRCCNPSMLGTVAAWHALAKTESSPAIGSGVWSRTTWPNVSKRETSGGCARAIAEGARPPPRQIFGAE